MSDIKFEQVVFQNDNKSEIEQVVGEYRKIMSIVCSNSQFQITHFELLNQGFEFFDYIDNDDITETSLNKIKDWNKQVVDVLNSNEYKIDTELLKLIGKHKYDNQDE